MIKLSSISFLIFIGYLASSVGANATSSSDNCPMMLTKVAKVFQLWGDINTKYGPDAQTAAADLAQKCAKYMANPQQDGTFMQSLNASRQNVSQKTKLVTDAQNQMRALTAEASPHLKKLGDEKNCIKDMRETTNDIYYLTKSIKDKIGSCGGSTDTKSPNNKKNR